MEFGSKVKCITIMWEKKKHLLLKRVLKNTDLYPLHCITEN